MNENSNGGDSTRSDDSVVDAVVTAYYSRVVSYPDELRRRAQNAFAVSGVFATGLAGVGLVATLANVSTAVKIVGVAALATWTLSAAAFAFAVAGTVSSAIQGSGVNGSVFVRAVMQNVERERDTVNRRRRVGQALTLIASLLTIATVAGSLFLQSEPSTRPAIAYLSPAAVRAASDGRCVDGRGRILGRIEVPSVDKEVVRLRVALDGCHQTLVLPRAAIIVVLLQEN